MKKITKLAFGPFALRQSDWRNLINHLFAYLLAELRIPVFMLSHVIQGSSVCFAYSFVSRWNQGQFADYNVGRVIRKGRGRHDTWFRVICIWNHLLKMAAVIGFSFKERFLRFQLLFPDFYPSIILFGEWSGQKSLKLKMDKICRPGPFRMTRPI